MTVTEPPKGGDDHVLKSSDTGPQIDDSKGPMLLRGHKKMQILTSHFTSFENGSSPEARAIADYISSGYINIDKSANPSSHEVVSWVKRILNVDKTGHSGTLDPKVTGCLIVCISRATRLAKSQQAAGKEYVVVIKLHESLPGGKKEFEQGLTQLKGALFQRPPVISAVKRELRIRTIYDVKLCEFDNEKKTGVFWVSCQAGTYIRTLCVHLGMTLGVGAHMLELRRVRSGAVDETSGCYSLHDLLDAHWLYKTYGDESYLRMVIQPLENLLVGLKRIIVKDSAVGAIIHGAKLMLPGIIQFDHGIEAREEIVIVTTKGEAVALANACVNSYTIEMGNHGLIAVLKRVIMDRGLYPAQWGRGPVAMMKKTLKAEGKLDKFGHANELTPTSWKDSYVEYGGQETNISAVIQKEGEKKKALHATFPDALSKLPTSDPTKPGSQGSDGSSKPKAAKVNKKQKHQEKKAKETPEERLQRKAKKAEKKLKKETESAASKPGTPETEGSR